METLFEIMLPPMKEPYPNVKAHAASVDEVTPVKEKKAAKHPAVAKRASANEPASSVAARKDELPVDMNIPMVVGLDKTIANAPVTPVKQAGRRKSKNNKFVPLTSFLSTKSTTTTTPVASTSSPWSLHAEEKKPAVATTKSVSPASPAFNPNAFPEAFPLPGSSLRKGSFDGPASRQRKSSIGSHPSASPRLSFSPLPVSGKHMLGYDGVEHEQVAAFSLDAFLKKPARRGTRGKCNATPAAPTWSSPSTGSEVATDQKPPPKTLKEIQEEEEAAAQRDREAKARLGGGIAPAQHSTVNSWGLFRTPDHVSLADVQKLQEEQEFLEQQRQILAEIEREQAAKARAGGDRKKGPGSSGTNRRGRKGNHTAATAASGTDGAGDSQSKQQKQKKVKERKAARKAAGETFADNGASSARPTQRKKSSKQQKSAAQTSEAKGGAKPAQPWPRRKNKSAEGQVHVAAA